MATGDAEQRHSEFQGHLTAIWGYVDYILFRGISHQKIQNPSWRASITSLDHQASTFLVAQLRRWYLLMWLSEFSLSWHPLGHMFTKHQLQSSNYKCLKIIFWQWRKNWHPYNGGNSPICNLTLKQRAAYAWKWVYSLILMALIRKHHNSSAPGILLASIHFKCAGQLAAKIYKQVHKMGSTFTFQETIMNKPIVRL